MDKEDVVLLLHKKNEIMPFAATWMDLENIILSEVSQKEKDKYYMIFSRSIHVTANGIISFL